MLSNIYCYSFLRFIWKVLIDGWLVWFGLVCELLFTFSKYALGNKRPVIWDEEGGILSFLSLLKAR